MSSQAYTNRQRVIAEASITKVQYAKGVAFTNKLSSTINCNPNFNRITYKGICYPCVSLPRPVAVVPVNPFARFNNQIALIDSGFGVIPYRFYPCVIVSYTPATMTVNFGPTNFNVPYTIISSISQLTPLNPFITRSIIFNNTPSNITLNFSVISLTVIIPPGQLLFNSYSLSPSLSFTIV